MLRLFVISSWGGVPVRTSGAALESLRNDGPVLFTSHPGHGVWIESIIPADDGTWYAYYHHERSADLCGRPDRQLPRIGALRSADRGHTWDDLGIIIDAPPGTEACDSGNRFVLGGVGDVTAALDAESKDVYLYFSQYLRDPAAQGVAVARLAWADRDEPVGKVTIWNDGAWLPDGLRHAADAGEATLPRSIGNQRRLLGPVDSLEHVSRAIRDAPQSREGRSVRAGRHLRVVFANAVGSHAVDDANEDLQWR